MSRRPGASRAAHRSVRTKVLALVATLIAVVPGVLTTAPAKASPAQVYSGPYFGDGNFPPGCIRDSSTSNPDNNCFHLKTDINSLDSPEIDVLILVPVSPTTERDMRIAHQAVDMWEGGIDYLAPQMDLGWLADGMNFHVTVDSFDPSITDGGEFTTYPVVDPEIVVITGNPVPTGGIGIDPVAKVADSVDPSVIKQLPPGLVVLDENAVPCHNVRNPFDFEYWENLPGFDRHHEARSGTYVEDCGGAGGNVCFTVAGGVDPLPDRIDGAKPFFDLVAHEFGHCMTLGHVGDGGETDFWGPAPYSDVMSYSEYPSLRNTCASTLDVEGLAIRMSRYLDTNGDGAVDASDRLFANDRTGKGGYPFQVQHPEDHLHASGTGAALDCPQADVGLQPGEPTDWTPEPVDTVEHRLEVSSPADAAASHDGRFDVAGTVERRALSDIPTNRTASTDDASGDSSDPLTDILGVDVELDDSGLHVTMHMAEMWTATNTSPVSYSAVVNGWALNASMTAGVISPGTEIDNVNKTVTFHRAPAYVRGYGRGRTEVSTSANFTAARIEDDFAPEPGHVLAVGDPAACGEGCAADLAPEQVKVHVDGVDAAGQEVDTDSTGTDSFSLPIAVGPGTHVVRVDWEYDGEVVASKSVTVRSTASDADSDGVADDVDNCPDQPNPGQGNMDGDAKGDECDADMDGDGYGNQLELTVGTDPADPASYPSLPGGGSLML